jgi:Fe-S-cluster containining protein
VATNPDHEHPHICTACAMCCNGALYDEVPTQEAERRALALLGFEFHTSGADVVFDQPCRMLVERCCTVYAARPQRCRAFRCVLLEAHEEGRVTREEALERIATARQLLDAVMTQLPAGQSIREARALWKDQAEATGDIEAMRTQGPQLMLAWVMLNRFLDRHFRRDHQRMMQVSAPDRK